MIKVVVTMPDVLLREDDVVLVPFPFVTDFSLTKARPAVVIENDIANKY